MSNLLNKLTHHNQHNDQHNAAGHHTAGQPIVGQPIVGQQTHLSGTNTTTVHQPVVHETTTYIAPVVQETIRQDKIVEVQPVVHREVDRNVVHHVEKHIREAPAPSIGGTVERAAVVDTNVVTNVVNEVQPIIHRERVVPVVERAEAHYAQRVVEPTVHTHEVVYDTTIYPNQQGGLVGQQHLGGQPIMGGQQPILGAQHQPIMGGQQPMLAKPGMAQPMAPQFQQAGAPVLGQQQPIMGQAPLAAQPLPPVALAGQTHPRV